MIENWPHLSSNEAEGRAFRWGALASLFFGDEMLSFHTYSHAVSDQESGRKFFHYAAGWSEFPEYGLGKVS